MRPPQAQPRFKRIVIAGAILIPVLYALIINLPALDSPPAWDSAITVSPAALEMVSLDFDIWQLAQLPSSPEGGPSTHSTSIYTIGLALLISWLGPALAFQLAHWVSIALVGGLAGATYLLARERATIYMSALAAGSVGVVPIVVQQASDIYLDLPLAILTTLACWAAVRRRFWLTSALVLAGIAIKTSGVFLLPLILFARPDERSWPRHITFSAVAGLLATIPFAVVIATTHRLSTGVTLSMTLPLLRSSAALLILTVDVFLVLALFFLVTYGRGRGGTLDRPSLVASITVGSFFLVHVATMLLSGTIAILPRYYIVLLPTVICALLPARQHHTEERPPVHTVATALLVVFAVFSILNVRGDLYPRPDDDFYVVAERSTRAQDLLELQVQGTRQLVATELPLLIERQVHFRLLYPGMGYVEETPEDVTSVFIDPPRDLPDRFAMLIERRFTNPLVPIEEAAIEEGYTLEYTDLQVGPFESQLIVASR